MWCNYFASNEQFSRAKFDSSQYSADCLITDIFHIVIVLTHFMSTSLKSLLGKKPHFVWLIFWHESLSSILQDLLFSYNIAIDRSNEVKRTLGKSAASVGLQLPEVYQS